MTVHQGPNLSNVTALAMDPGGLPASRAQAKQKKPTQLLFAVINFLMSVLKHLTSTFRTTEDAGRDLVTVSMDSAFQGHRGYYVGRKQDVPAAASTDEKSQKRLWEAVGDGLVFSPVRRCCRMSLFNCNMPNYSSP